MNPFYIIFIILALAAFLDIYRIKPSQRVLLLWLITLLLVLFTGLRFGMPDYEGYVKIFKLAYHYNINASPDIGYTLLNMLVGVFFSNPIAMFLIVAFLSVTLMVKCYKDYSRYVFVAILLYFVHTYLLREMMQIRAGMACAICLYNIRNIEKGKILKFNVLQVLAMSVHLASGVFLLVPLLKKLNFSHRTWYWLLAICFAIGTFSPLGKLVQLLPATEYTNRILVYAHWKQYAGMLGILGNPATLKQLLMCILGLIYYDTIKQNVKYYNILLPAYLASTCWLMLWNDFAIFAARIATFWSIGEPILMAQLLTVFTPRSRQLVVIGLIGVALLFLMLNIHSKSIVYHLNPIVLP